MKKALIGAVVLVAGVFAVRRFGPKLAERGMRKCHEMLAQAAREDHKSALTPTPEAGERLCA